MHGEEVAMNPVHKHFGLHIAEIVEPKKHVKFKQLKGSYLTSE
jgi:hypothetical protein